MCDFWTTKNSIRLDVRAHNVKLYKALPPNNLKAFNFSQTVFVGTKVGIFTIEAFHSSTSAIVASALSLQILSTRTPATSCCQTDTDCRKAVEWRSYTDRHWPYSILSISKKGFTLNDIYAVELVIYVAIITRCLLQFINKKHPSVLGASNLAAMSKEKRT